jgi:hypothetical protein
VGVALSPNRAPARSPIVRALGVCGVVVAITPSPAPAASSGTVGGLHAAITEAPTSFDYRHTVEMSYALTFATGAAEERFAIDVLTPRFPDSEGSPFAGPVEPLFPLSGPAQRGSGREITGYVACSPYNVIHGTDPLGVKWDIVAPPQTTSTLRATFRIWRRDAPFPGQDVRPTFLITPELVAPPGGGLATIPGTLKLRPTRRPRLKGPLGVVISMPTQPRSADGLRGGTPTYRRGQVFRVYGRTRPVLRRQVIGLRALTPGPLRRPHLIASVRTDRRGRFSYRWRPLQPGTHQLFAFYRQQQRGVTSDRACPRVVEIR